MVHYGGTNNHRCHNPDCPAKGRRIRYKREPIKDNEKIPATGLCAACEKEVEEFNAEIERGGVQWKCTLCQSQGLIKHDAEFAISFRKEHPDKGVGVEIGEESCPKCQGLKTQFDKGEA